jgi:cobalamin biosynthesis protein CobT
MANPFIGSLPLIASTLGHKYGLKVLIGGDQAASDGQNIYLPALPLDSPPELVNLARGYLDHEAAHIRETDFDLASKTNFKPLEKHIWNIIEDYRVEKLLGERYPGCRQNFEWLILRFFDQDYEDGTPEQNILDWLLLSVRSWAVPKLENKVEAKAEALEKDCPGLIRKLVPILEEIKTNCPDTKAAINLAQKIVRVLADFANNNSSGHDAQNQNQKPGQANSSSEDKLSCGQGEQEPGSGDQTDARENKLSQPRAKQPNNLDGQSTDPTAFNDKADSQGEDSPGSASILKSLLDKSSKDLPPTLDAMMENCLSNASTVLDVCRMAVAEACSMDLKELTENNLQEARQTTILLKSRLQNLLQGLTINHSGSGYRGRLDSQRVHRLFQDSPKIFRSQKTRVGLDVAVHLLLDASGSMGGRIGLASLTAYAMCEALVGVKGINVAVTAFPGLPVINSAQKENIWATTVAPILKHGQKLHQRFQLQATGQTPLAQSLWWVIQEMALLRESRKIIFIVTDGEPDSKEEAQIAIKSAQNIGLEIYGLGLMTPSVKDLLPGRSVVLNNLVDLPQKLFGLLGQAMNNKQ